MLFNQNVRFHLVPLRMSLESFILQIRRHLSTADIKTKTDMLLKKYLHRCISQVPAVHNNVLSYSLEENFLRNLFCFYIK